MHRQEQLNVLNVNAGSALRESHGDYLTLFELAPIAVYSCDASVSSRNTTTAPLNCGAANQHQGIPTRRLCGSFKLYSPRRQLSATCGMCHGRRPDWQDFRSP